MAYQVLATRNICNGTAFILASVILANDFGKVTSGNTLKVNGSQITIANISFAPSLTNKDSSHQGVFIQATLNIKVGDIVTVTRKYARQYKYTRQTDKPSM